MAGGGENAQGANISLEEQKRGLEPEHDKGRGGKLDGKVRVSQGPGCIKGKPTRRGELETVRVGNTATGERSKGGIELTARITSAEKAFSGSEKVKKKSGKAASVTC